MILGSDGFNKISLFLKTVFVKFKCGFLTSCNLYPQKATGIPTQDGLENKMWMFF